MNSMSDMFGEGVSDEFLDQCFAVMGLASQHQFQVLTKRPERMIAYLTRPATAGRYLNVAAAMEYPEVKS